MTLQNFGQDHHHDFIQRLSMTRSISGFLALLFLSPTHAQARPSNRGSCGEGGRLFTLIDKANSSPKI